jgi:hypothetical protein
MLCAEQIKGVGYTERGEYLMRTHELDETVTENDGLERTLEIESVVIRRMIEEVRSGDSIGAPTSYNRTHNKHNR